MKLSMLLIVAAVAPLSLLADPVCPADPTQLILGAPWAFQARSPDLDAITSAATVGTFTAKPGGTLSAILTVSQNGAVTRRANASGRYILYPDCSGGEIMIMLNGFSAQLEFVWANNFSQMLFVTDNLVLADPQATTILIGSAKRAPNGCPAGLGDPLNILTSGKWAYQFYAGYFAQGSFTVGGSASVGLFKASVAAGQGVLSSTETSVTVASFGAPQSQTSRLMQETGRYQIYPDCSGGEIMFMNRFPGAVQFEFVFAGPNFDEIDMLADSTVAISDAGLFGQALKY